LARGVLADHPPTPEAARLKEWVIGRCPVIAEGQTHLERAALYWVEWNRLVEPYADRMLWLGGVTPEDVTSVARMVQPDAALVGPLPPPLDTSSHPELTWAELTTLVRPEICRRVADMAERYGYR
jgi:hypothetical protein